ncbi:MAG: PIN domain-containing protein [Gemmatimonadaceae bacterium]
MGIILDTSILIAAERSLFDLEALVAASVDETFAIAAISASEFLHGVERTREPSLRAQRSRFAEGVLDSLAVIPFGLAEARTHASLWAGLAAKGRVIGAHDLQVAATALSIGSAVATLNQKEFKRVPGLALVPVARFAKT